MDRDKWSQVRWDEDDTFKVHVQSLGDPVFNICHGLERYYKFHGVEYPNLLFTEFCEESMLICFHSVQQALSCRVEVFGGC